MSSPDDLPWPELGNVSRGATRGNQGQKGALSPPDRDGRCVLQLRVQPGVLCVSLNKKASEWYRILDNEVNHALKLTKTYWRKARRRQDYDARADQDHMELHEWLQQLKDRTMSYLELHIQKGDIPGPPYTMPDEVELTFLRKFIERQAAGIPHNPRLRNAFMDGDHSYRAVSISSVTSDPSDHPYHRDVNGQLIVDSNSLLVRSLDPLLHNGDSFAHEAAASKQALHTARLSFGRAQKETQEAFMRYTTCLDIQRQAKTAVTAAEKRRDDIMALLLARNQHEQDGIRSSRNSSFSEDEMSPTEFPSEMDIRSSSHFFGHARLMSRNAEWPDSNNDDGYPNGSASHTEDNSGRERKHLRVWDTAQLPDAQYNCDIWTHGQTKSHY